MEYLVDHALRNAWSSPRQDNRLVLVPRRISPPQGSMNYFTTMDTVLKLPNGNTLMYVYQFGQLDPKSLGLLRQVPHWAVQKWFSFAEAVKANNIEVTIHTANGVTLPRDKCLYMFLDERALIMAVPVIGTFATDFSREPIYLRLYTNHFFKTPRAQFNSLTSGSFNPQSTNEILQMENSLAAIIDYPQYFRYYINGLLSTRPTLLNTKPGDTVEWVRDTSILRVDEWKLSTLYRFNSQRDGNYKYLLNHQVDKPDRKIHYFDDCDFFVSYRPTDGSPERGVYLNMNMESNVRALTHKDFAVSSGMVSLLRDHIAEILGIPQPDSETIFIKAYVRDGGIRNTLGFESNHIHELYKLKAEERRRAMIGVDSLVPFWRCSELESSYFMTMLDTHFHGVDLGLVEKAYGYDACSVILANTPQKMEPSESGPVAKLPYLLAQKATVYEFDRYGKMLTYREHGNDDTYDAVDPNCEMIEALVGAPSLRPDSYYGKDNIPIPRGGYDYRVYMGHEHEGQVIPNSWEDITDSNYYEVEDGFIRWKLPTTTHLLMVRTNAKILAYDIRVKQNDGLLNFSILESETGVAGDPMKTMEVPMAQLAIWMNNHRLVEGVDFIYRFPQVFVTNRIHLKQPVSVEEQHFHIRMCGLPERGFTQDASKEVGWVSNGWLSNNHIFNVRDDKVLQINIGGSIYHREDIVFDEDSIEDSVLHHLNGRPYQIQELMVPFRLETITPSLTMRRESLEKDRMISEYMTSRFEGMGTENVSAIQYRYPVVSVFFSHITYLVVNDKIDIPRERLLDDIEIRELCQPYMTLFDFDHGKGSNQLDERFSYIIPHAEPYAIHLSFQKYQFIRAAARIFYGELLGITDYYVIS